MIVISNHKNRNKKLYKKIKKTEINKSKSEEKFYKLKNYKNK